jgi:hypothetical protein
VLVRVIERLARAGEQAGISVEQMIQILNAGVSVETLVDLIDRSPQLHPAETVRCSRWIMQRRPTPPEHPV